MLKVFKAESFFEGSFADEPITGSDIDFENKYLKFMIAGAQSEDEHENTLVFKNIEMEISNWSEMILKMQLPEKEMPNEMKMREISSEEFEIFDDIILFHFNNESLTIEGFGKKSLVWCKYKFLNPKIVIKGELVSS